MNFISTNEGGFDTNLPISKCLSIEHDSKIKRIKDKSTRRLAGGVITRNPLMSTDLMNNKNNILLQKYDDYCDNNYEKLTDAFQEYLRDLGYGSTEDVEDGYEEFCRESYMEICAKKDEPLFDKIA